MKFSQFTKDPHFTVTPSVSSFSALNYLPNLITHIAKIFSYNYKKNGHCLMMLEFNSKHRIYTPLLLVWYSSRVIFVFSRCTVTVSIFLKLVDPKTSRLAHYLAKTTLNNVFRTVCIPWDQLGFESRQILEIVLEIGILINDNYKKILYNPRRKQNTLFI